MRPLLSLSLTLLLSLSLLPSLPAAAQTPTTPSADAPQSLDPAERRAQSAQSLDRMRGTLASIQKTLDAKREEKDILLLNCLSARVSAVKGFLKIAEQANIALQTSADPSSDLHNLNLISLADAKVQTLKDEADACAGGDISAQYSGPSRSVLKVDDGIRRDTDLDTVNFFSDMPLDPLPEATPYQ